MKTTGGGGVAGAGLAGTVVGAVGVVVAAGV
jgi:hypothetical protein